MIARKICLLLLLLNIQSNAQAPTNGKPVSIVAVISTPEKFDGKLISITGFLRIGRESRRFGQQPVLYLHEEDSKHLLIQNAVWVNPSEKMQRDWEKVDGMYVNVVGVFKKGEGGDPAAFEGATLTNVVYYSIQSDPKRPRGIPASPDR